MSEIRFFALGGLGENGKNMYVVDVDRQYFILDAGIKYPSLDLFGVDEIIPNYKMLINIKDRIKGIFISHAHEDHIGALPYVLKELNVPVYATSFTMEIIKDLLKDNDFNLDNLTLNTITKDSIIKSGNVKITFFQTTHSIPESIGIVIHTVRGSIVYTSDFTFSQTGMEIYQTDFNKINEIAQRKVIALLPESLGSLMVQDGGVKDSFINEVNSIYANAKGRIIVSLFSSELQKIQQIIDLSLNHKKKIAVIGIRTQRIVDIAIKKGYLNIPKNSFVNLKFISETNANDDPNLVCLVAGNRHEPFFMLQRMCYKQDRLIHINEDDTVLILTPPIPGTERMLAKTLDVLYRSDAEIKVIDKKLLMSSHASKEELKIMINLLSPEYIIPTIGEYRHQYGVKTLANEIGYKDNNILLLDNGDIVNFLPKREAYVSKSEIKTGDILIDGTAVGDVNDYVMRDREILASDGMVVVIGNVNTKTKEIISKIEVVTKGFVYVNDDRPIINQIKDIYTTVVNKYFNKNYLNWNELKLEIRDEISKILYSETRRRPLIIPVVISSEQ